MSSFLGKISEKYISLSSQVDVYRNIKDYRFNYMLSFDDEVKLYNKICSSFYKLYYSDRFSFEKVNTKEKVLKYYNKGLFLDCNDIFRENSYVGSRDDEFAFVNINIREHLRFTGKLPGVNFFRCGHFAYGLESDMDSKLDFAFNTNFGYVFEDVNLVGNGLKMTGVLHIPSLKYYKTTDFLEKKMRNLGIKFYSLSELGLCEDFYIAEFLNPTAEEFSAIRKMDKYITEIVNLEIDNRRKLLGIKTDYYREKFEKYKKILIKKENITPYIVSKFISLCLLLQSLEIIVGYDVKLLYECLMKVRSSTFLPEKESNVELLDSVLKLI